MATKEFIMEQYNGTDYDILHPQTDAGQVLFGNSTVQQMLTNGVVRTDAQTLTTTEKEQARTNIDASAVSGTNDGTNWTGFTVNGVTKSIPQGGGTQHLYQHLVCIDAIDSTTQNRCEVQMVIFTQSATPFTTSDIRNYLLNTSYNAWSVQRALYLFVQQSSYNYYSCLTFYCSVDELVVGCLDEQHQITNHRWNINQYVTLSSDTVTQLL